MNRAEDVQRAAGQCLKLKAELAKSSAWMIQATTANDEELLRTLGRLLPEHLRTRDVTCICPTRGYDWHGVSIDVDGRDHRLEITIEDGKWVRVEHNEVVPEKCASPVPEPIIDSKSERHRQEARSLQEILNTPDLATAVVFRKCMAARRVAAAYFSRH